MGNHTYYSGIYLFTFTGTEDGSRILQVLSTC